MTGGFEKKLLMDFRSKFFFLAKLFSLKFSRKNKILFKKISTAQKGHLLPVRGGQRDDNKAKNPKAPLLVLVVPNSCLALPAGDMRQFVSHLALFTAHHVLASAVFPAETIRRRDVNKMLTAFALITTKFYNHPTFWKDVRRL